MTTMYFPLNEDNLKQIKQNGQVIANCDSANKPKGNHHVKHSDAARKKISKTQKKRNKILREILSRPLITEERVKEITKGVVAEFIHNNTIEVIRNNTRQTPININL